MEERTFSWFPKLTRTMKKLPPESVAEFAMACAEYGTYGTEPSFSEPLMDALFESVREDIDNSIASRYRNKGGRPPKNPRENGGSEVSETCETGVSENENPAKQVSKAENPSYINQTIPSQTKPNQDKEEGGSRKRFTPPTPEEVAAYAEERGESIDAHRFCDYHASRGWVVGRNPMRDWRAAVRTWLRNDAQWASGRKGAEDDAELDLYASLV